MNSRDRWVIIKVDEDLHKVFGMWYGSYLCGESWRLNSGIVKVEEDGEDHYLFHGESGSIYRCHKEAYGTSGYGSCVLFENGLKPLEDYKQYIEEELKS